MAQQVLEVVAEELVLLEQMLQVLVLEVLQVVLAV
jgi:hypothetical protein